MPLASIGVSSYTKSNFKRPELEVPDSYFEGGTTGIGTGAGAQRFSRYPSDANFHRQYRPGAKMFWKLSKGNYYGPKGTWGHTEMRKYAPIKQISGSAGYLSQKPGIKRSSDYNVMVNVGRVVKDPFLPRGGSVMRVVGTENQEPEDSLTIGYNTYGGQNNPGARDNDDDDKDYRGRNMDRRNAGFVPYLNANGAAADQPNAEAPDEEWFDAEEQFGPSVNDPVAANVLDNLINVSLFNSS